MSAFVQRTYLVGVRLMTNASRLDGDLGRGTARAAAGSLDSLENLHRVIGNLSEDDMTAVEPGSSNGGDKELRAVGVWASVSHGEDTGANVLQLEVLIVERLNPLGVSIGIDVLLNITTLNHEVGDDTVEVRADVSWEEVGEVLDCLGNNIGAKVEVQVPDALIVDGDLEVGLLHGLSEDAAGGADGQQASKGDGGYSLHLEKVEVIGEQR